MLGSLIILGSYIIWWIWIISESYLIRKWNHLRKFYDEKKLYHVRKLYHIRKYVIISGSSSSSCCEGAVSGCSVHQSPHQSPHALQWHGMGSREERPAGGGTRHRSHLHKIPLSWWMETRAVAQNKFYLSWMNIIAECWWEANGRFYPLCLVF